MGMKRRKRQAWAIPKPVGWTRWWKQELVHVAVAGVIHLQNLYKNCSKVRMEKQVTMIRFWVADMRKSLGQLVNNREAQATPMIAFHRFKIYCSCHTGGLSQLMGVAHNRTHSWALLWLVTTISCVMMGDTDKIETIRYRSFPSNIACIDTYQYDNHTHFN